MRALFIILGAFSAMAASATALALVGLPYQPLGLAFLQGNPYGPPSISAEANGSATPEMLPDATEEDFIENGDFKIFLAGGNNKTLGDGIDEVTVWDFDFTADSRFESFPDSEPLSSARLTLTLTPKSLLFDSDVLRISGLADITPPVYAELPVRETSTIDVELLEFYTSEEILGVLNEDGGKITMASYDDAIVSSAKLVLVSQSPAVE